MPLGLCIIHLRVPESGSLKDKRRALKSIVDRVHNRFNVSIAEVAENDSIHSVTLAVSVVSISAPHVNSVLSNVVEFVERARLDAELVDYEIDITHPF